MLEEITSLYGYKGRWVFMQTQGLAGSED